MYQIGSEIVKFNWVPYDFDKHKEIDDWNHGNLDIDKYALYGDTFLMMVDWYEKNPDDPISNFKDFIYVIENGHQIIGFVVCNVSCINEKYVSNLNPIVVNPNILNKGVGYQIVQELISDANRLLEKDIAYFLVMIDCSNSISRRLFEKVGFKIFQEENGYLEYRYYLKEE